MKKFGLATQIFVALVLGIVVGALFHGNETAMAILVPIGDIFIHLIKLIVIPIVMAALVVSIAGVGDIKKLGKLGGKTLLYFEIVTTIAIVIGLLAANLFHPGSGLDTSNLEKVIFQIMKKQQKQLEAIALEKQFLILFLKIYLNQWLKRIYYRLSSFLFYSA